MNKKIELDILKSYGFDEKFPPAVIKEAKFVSSPGKIGGGTPGASSPTRVDLTKLLTITIDGEDSRDFDDAVTVQKAENGFVLWVHIADVAEYVRAGSPLDKEAGKRGTSVYFPQSVFPMLPRELSNGICSLNPNEKRLALTVKIELDKGGKTLNSEIFESVIKSDFRLTYTEVNQIISPTASGSPPYPKGELSAELINMLFEMKELHGKLLAQKEKRGAIEFVSRETKLVFDKKGEVSDIKPYPYGVSNSVIEEFMVLANSVVAEKFNALKLPFVYRVHDKPDEEKLENFITFAKTRGIKFDRKNIAPAQFKKILAGVKGTPIDAIVSKIMLRSMQKAIYKTKCDGHFGLALTYYCHFTSPIRRYPDLFIHRVIKMYLHGKLQSGIIPKIRYAAEQASKRSSEREKAAETAERDVDDTYKAAYMAKHLGEEFDGVISGVTNFGIFVELENTCEGLVHIKYLPDDEYNFIAERYLLEGKTHSFTFGQQVRVKVAAARPEEGKVSFDLVI